MDAKVPGGFLEETIPSQPEMIERLLQNPFPDSAFARIAGCTRIFVVGTGTSFHGALTGQYLLRSAGIDAWAVRAFDFANYPPATRPGDGLVLLSHRGSKRFSQAALKPFEGNDNWMAITGEASPLSGPGVVQTVAQERSPVHTASHTGAMVRLAQLAVALGSPTWKAQLGQLSKAVGAAAGLRVEVRQALDQLHWGRTFHFVGGGPAYATAMEGALKLREASFLSAEGHELESILHGPLVSVEAADTVVLIAQPGASLDRTAELAAALHEIGAPTVAVGSAARRLPFTTVQLETPPVDELLAPIVNVVPLQWLALEASRRAGVDADSFRKHGPHGAAQTKFTL